MKGHNLPSVSEIRYLGTYIIKGRQFRCFVTNAKRTLQLVKNKCLPILLYGLKCYSLLKADLHSLDFVVMRFLMNIQNYKQGHRR